MSFVCACGRCGWAHLWVCIWAVCINKINPLVVWSKSSVSTYEDEVLGHSDTASDTSKRLDFVSRSLSSARLSTPVYAVSYVSVRGDTTPDALNSYLKHTRLSEPRNPAAIGP